MSYKKSKKASFDKNCVMEALHLRGSSIRKLDNAYGFGWSSKSVERGLRDGEVSPDLLDALGRYLNVEPDYLAGKYHRECEKVKDPFIREIWIRSLKAEKYPYILKLLASGGNDHSESGRINQFQPLKNSQYTSATPFLN